MNHRQTFFIVIPLTLTVRPHLVSSYALTGRFCGGEAHSEMANMAERVWKVAGPTIMQMLDDNPTYTFVITGHSLGGGVATLLNILLHQNEREVIRGHRSVECFAFASPPTFTPLESVPSDALDACTNYIHERDVVPFLSVDGVRHLFNCISAIENQSYSWSQRMQLATGNAEPDEALIDAVRRANENRLVPKPGAPILAVPAKTNVWMREDKGTGRYDAKLCDSMAMAKLGILIDAKMLEDHFPSRYEHALHNLEE